MKWILILLMTLSVRGYSQIYMTTNGRVEFFSEAPLENITAINSTVSSLINTNTDSVFVRMKNTGFVFKNALMQEHFNENYMESLKYPIDSFKGKMNEEIDYTKEGTYVVTATGKMMIHGVQQQQTLTGTLVINNQQLQLNAKFNIHTSDFKIEIPKLLFEKIAEEIQVSFNAVYKSKK